MTVQRKTLNPRMIGALPPAPRGSKYDVHDVIVPGFAVRVTDTGAKSFVLIKRMPGAKHPTRRTIARVGAVDLTQARATARRWLEEIATGADPRAKMEAEAAQVERARADAFDAVMEVYISQRLGGKKAAEIARALRREFGGRDPNGKPIGPWAGRSIKSITTEDVADAVMQKAASAPIQARNVLSHLGRFFRWAVSRGKVPFSPAGQIKPGDLLGYVKPRTRHLDDAELRRVWQAAVSYAYPWGAIYQFLVLTGARLNEVADARWSEFDLRRRLWTVPGGRMKGKLDHAVPLSPMVLTVLGSLPRWNEGDFLFSNTNGRKSVTVSDYIKGRLDVAARVFDWRNHDIRRTVRTHLSAIPSIPECVRELMIAHRRKGIEGTYDRHEYLNEKRAGFEAWEDRLMTILNAEPGTVRRAA
ncbi:MAG: tyrosine-type recombinase/integrase [Burkholderiaceae bacterium]